MKRITHFKSRERRSKRYCMSHLPGKWIVKIGVLIFIVGYLCSSPRGYTFDLSQLGKKKDSKKVVSSKKFMYPRDVAISKDGKIYVTLSDHYGILLYDKNCKFVRHWGKQAAKQREPSAPGELWGKTRIDLAPDGTLYVADVRIQKFNPEGEYIGVWDKRPDKEWSVNDIAVGPDGTVYLLIGLHIKQYTADGKFIRQWGGKSGKGPGEFNYPMALDVASDGSVYVAEWHNYRVQQFKADGTFVRMWGLRAKDGGKFGELSGIAVAPDGSVYV